MPNPCNVPSRTIFIGDNLDILRGINSECVDLIYLDPPFNSNETYAAPLDSEAKGAEFDDVWTLDDMKEEWIDEIEIRRPSLYHLINGGVSEVLAQFEVSLPPCINLQRALSLFWDTNILPINVKVRYGEWWHV